MNWWTDAPSELYWCEITDRPDVGADLKCPQANERGQDHWSYSLIRDIWPGDIVFHYWTPARAFVGASVAGGPLEERPIVWAPHGTVGRAKPELREPRPGWWLPLYGYREAGVPLWLRALHDPVEDTWIREWISERGEAAGRGSVKAPLQLYPGKLRASQGYLTKMPEAFVARWPELDTMAAQIEQAQETLAPVGGVAPPPGAVAPAEQLGARFKPKSETDYLAVVRAQVQHRTRRHERLVREAGEWLRDRGGVVSTPHPIDLFLGGAVPILFEAKVVGQRADLAAVREAIGQLHEYRWFYGPRESLLCVLLDQEPGSALVPYVEGHLGLLLAWWSDNTLAMGPSTSIRLAREGIGFDGL